MRETIFVWDSVSDCVMSELDGSGAVQVTYTNEPQQYGGVISQRRGTTTSTYHADALGSTRALTDNSGAVTDTYLNDAWGNSVASTGTTVNPFRWVGKYGYYTDNSTGQVYVRARMYQPTVARWCSVDPVFAVLSTDLYPYAANSPAIMFDPSGLVCCAPDQKCCVCKWRRHVQEEKIAALDSAFADPAAIPYARLAAGLIQSLFNKQAKYLGLSPIDVSVPTHSGVHRVGNGTRFVNGFLFFVSADVCEQSPGDCLTDFAETGKWLWNWDDGWRTESKDGVGPEYTNRSPTDPLNPQPGAKQPFIARLAVPNGNCDKRIVWGDMPSSGGTVGDQQFKDQIRAWGAKQVYRVHGAETNGYAELRLRFALFTSTSALYTIAPVGESAAIGNSSVVGASDIPQAIGCRS